jgi:peptide methionine sulfoxide reductase MsrB
MDKAIRTGAEWRELFSPREGKVLRQAGTEVPFTGEGCDVLTDQALHINSISPTLAPASS